MFQQRKVINVTAPPQVIRVTVEQEVSIMDILKTVTWREVFDMLLGITIIVCFMIGLVFAFWV